MLMQKLIHSDCKNYCPIDDMKGICRITNETISKDSLICKHFEELPKCKNCDNFKNPNEDNIGTCIGRKNESLTYGDLKATLCEVYKKNL